MKNLDIAEVARHSGVPASMLRFYEEKGLIASIGKRGLRRVFDAGVLDKHIIGHHFCKTCGCAPFATGKTPDGTETAAVNVRCIEGMVLAAVKRIPVDGRSL